MVAQNEIASSLSKKQISLLLLIDFSKAFDMVNHDILLAKLNHYGIRGIANKWFKSYLSNREQYVCINGKSSSKQSLKYSVPQGSILGPLLFVIYINDMPNINNIAKFILYADDANIIISGNNISEISTKFCELSKALVDWVSQNELLINTKKTYYMIFTRSRNLNMEAFVPKIANIPIRRTTVARFLGVLIDDKLSWTEHIAAIKSKMSKYIGVLYKLKHILPLKARLTTFNSLVQSHINFCSLVWGSTTKSKIDSLFTTQKKAMREVMPGWVNYFYKNGLCPSHTKSSFMDFGILTVQNIVLRNILIFINKVHNFPNQLPDSVRQTIPSHALSVNANNDYCSEWYTTYNSIPFNKTTFFKGPLLYNNIMTDNPQLHYISRDNFKKQSKIYLIKVQSSGDILEWQTDNFKLTNITGLRRSARLLQQADTKNST